MPPDVIAADMPDLLTAQTPAGRFAKWVTPAHYAFERETLVQRLAEARDRVRADYAKNGIVSQAGSGKVGGAPSVLEGLSTAVRKKVCKIVRQDAQANIPLRKSAGSVAEIIHRKIDHKTVSAMRTEIATEKW